jgi:uncharacterized membrane protein (DUF106 family)
MENQKNRSGLLMAIRLLIAGYPVHEWLFTAIIAKLTMNNELLSELEDDYQSIVASFLEIKADQARLRKLEIEKRRTMKELRKLYRKARKIVKKEMPKEKWAEFGIYDEK